MSEVKLAKPKQKKIKVLSKIISVFSKIGKILVTVAIPFIVLAMIIVPMVLDKVDVVNNEIVIKGTDEKIAIVEEKEDDNIVLKFKVNDSVVATEKNATSIANVKKFLGSNSKGLLIGITEAGMLLAIVNLILYRKILHNAEEFFKNISSKDTPFVIENVDYIKQTGWLMIIAMIIPICIEVVVKLIFKLDFNINWHFGGILEILAIFVLGYIFEYGYEMQLDSKARIYGSVEEEK